MLLNQLILQIPNAVDSTFCKKYIDFVEQQNYPITTNTKNFVQRPLEGVDLSEVAISLQNMLGYYQQTVPVFNFYATPVKLETPVVKKYQAGGKDYFGEHMDNCDHITSTRFMAFLTYLNDVEEGGETVFPQLGISIKPKAGTSVIFPPYWMFKHRAEAPVSNNKYIMTTYFRYASTEGE